MSAGHTPGPYVAHGREDGRGLSWTVGRPEIGRHFTLARVFRPAGDGPDVAKANALLFAAAPDLLEAAPDAADLLDRYAAFIRDSVKADDLEMHPYFPSIEDTARGLRAAIRRATGEQP